MIKSLHRTNTQTTPFIVTKDWQLSNVFNDDLILTEHSGSPIALEYVAFNNVSADENSACNISLEQQTDDKINLREGKKATGIFYPDEEETNLDGTFKRLVYSQIREIFYNNYRDPTKIWGMEYIDFDKSQTKRFLADKFQIYDVPTLVFGEKIVENSVVVSNRTQDNEYDITDDGRGNLFARRNLFSRQQEIGYFTQLYESGSTSTCDGYFNKYILASVTEPASTHIGFLFGTLAESPFTESMGGLATGIDVGFLTGELITTIVPSSDNDSGSIDISFLTGSLNDTIITTSSFDSSSNDVGFLTGSLVTTIITSSSSFDSSSNDVGFLTGSVTTTVISGSDLTYSSSINVGFLSGFIS